MGDRQKPGFELPIIALESTKILYRVHEDLTHEIISIGCSLGPEVPADGGRRCAGLVT